MAHHTTLTLRYVLAVLTLSLFQTSCFGGADDNSQVNDPKNDGPEGTENRRDSDNQNATGETDPSSESETSAGGDTDTVIHTDTATVIGSDIHQSYDTDNDTHPMSPDSGPPPDHGETDSWTDESDTSPPSHLVDTAVTPETNIPDDAETKISSGCENTAGVIFWDTDSDVLRWGRPGHYDHDTDSQWEDTETQWTQPLEPDTSTAFEAYASEMSSSGPGCDDFQLKSLTPRLVSNLFAVGATALDVSTEHVTTFGGPGSQHVYRFSADWHPEWTSKCMGDISDGFRHNDGTYYIVSADDAPTASTNGIRVSRLRENGTFLWSHLFGNTTYTVPYMNIVANPDGGVFVSAHADAKGGGLVELKLLSIDTDGKLLWVNRIPLSDDTPIADWSRVATALDANGDIVQITPSQDTMRFIHTSKDGTPIADVTIDENASPQDVFILPEGDMLLIANTEAGQLLLRLSPSGDIRQRPEVASSTSSTLSVGATDPVSGHIFLGGEKRDAVTGQAIGWHMVLDAEFNMLCEWQGGKLLSSPTTYATLPGGGVAFSERFVFHVSAIVPQADN